MKKTGKDELEQIYESAGVLTERRATEAEAPEGTPELAGKLSQLSKGVIAALTDDDRSNQDAIELIDQMEKDLKTLREKIGKTEDRSEEAMSDDA